MELRLIDFLIAKQKQNISNNTARPPLTEYTIFIKIQLRNTNVQTCLQWGCGKSFPKLIVMTEYCEGASQHQEYVSFVEIGWIDLPLERYLQ